MGHLELSLGGGDVGRVVNVDVGGGQLDQVAGGGGVKGGLELGLGRLDLGGVVEGGGGGGGQEDGEDLGRMTVSDSEIGSQDDLGRHLTLFFKLSKGPT